MTPAQRDAAIEPRITLDDVKHRAEVVRDLAVSEVKQVAEKALDESAGKTLLVVAGLVVVAASLAFFLGTRAVRPRGPGL